jgi:GDP-D-mannose dehydratase
VPQAVKQSLYLIDYTFCENILNILEAMRFAAGTQDKLDLGNIDIQRDWGWAEDYVVAMYLMLQQERSDDYAIAKRCLEQVATGESYQ